MLTRLVAGVVAVGLATSACVPQAEFDPVAVRLDAAGRVEILYTACEPAGVVRVDLVAPGERDYDEGSPRAWRVDFAEPARVTRFVVGEPPAGAAETVPAREPRPGEDLVAEVHLADGTVEYESFVLEDLAGGKVRYHVKNMSAEEFAKASSCG
ncbi:hypothetical protein [Saccharothrix variisporea]|uniref:Lipoprotein n=1 Tax=Saccharothrix variisporea TaxID=543527 RepID=A0A495XER5_9PSEU|nr:hypothetical protein [Saccharothrix variisporea]RKT72951.1 hypothetical protein DFJ66_6277 [Saccharothrix variisporea]